MKDILGHQYNGGGSYSHGVDLIGMKWLKLPSLVKYFSFEEISVVLKERLKQNYLS